ncbi:hypothetical protein [Methylobacterium frigidaeris]|uniref:Uncharacterized protein n=1 Tax=Methylobacterium frigidaeris TaxID=2038277 RepID=A0AA37HE04_9HYPH|nr:hypothetical protein [Methylobacterium frigidaeris]GJD64257.1 hypothetical protein MPEAHAMD_4438 [Methylobacterium frigidaeris]
MTFEVMGVLTLAAGILCLLYGRATAIGLFLFSTLLGSSAATILTALGSANVQPAHLLLGFLLLVCSRPPYAVRALQGLAFPSPGFWFLLTGIYGVFSAVFLPRLFEGASYVFAISRTAFGKAILMTPLTPGSGNITQTVYFLGNVACFCIFYGFTQDRSGKRIVADALVLCGIINIGFAVLDYVTFATGTASLLGFMRNASYNMLDATEMAGMKRIVGSFTEASAFAGATLALFAFSFNLWLNRYRSRLTGPLSLLLLIALVLSTSTTAYVGSAIYLAIVYGANVARLIAGRAGARRAAFLGLGPIVLAVLVLGVAHTQQASAYLAGLLDQIVFNKGVSESALERGNWNSQAMVNFFDSYGLGIGVGSTRASSFAIAALASIGVPGTAAYLCFIASTIVAPWREADVEAFAVRSAAGSACLAMVTAACIAGTTIDLGLVFYVLAAVAAAPLAEELRDPTAAAAGAKPSPLPALA